MIQLVRPLSSKLEGPALMGTISNNKFSIYFAGEHFSKAESFFMQPYCLQFIAMLYKISELVMSNEL